MFATLTKSFLGTLTFFLNSGAAILNKSAPTLFAARTINIYFNEGDCTRAAKTLPGCLVCPRKKGKSAEFYASISYEIKIKNDYSKSCRTRKPLV